MRNWSKTDGGQNGLEFSRDFPAVMVKNKLFLESVVAGTRENKTWNNKELG
jgi:hypothetical protein